MPHADADEAGAEVLPATELGETAYAKVNLALHVRGRRADGYHALESLFVFAEQGDGLSGAIRADGKFQLRCEGPFGHLLDADAENLVLKAARFLQRLLGESRGADLLLVKNLPVASGIGGGSADAAATLRLLLRLWEASIAPGELHDLALSLGSDVPACLASVTQMVTGRGEALQRHDVNGLDRKPMLLVNPGVAVSTGRIFAGWDQVDRGPLRAASLGDLVKDGRNDLQPAAIADAPVIGQVLEALNRCDAVRLARMSGSGATCFALFDNAAALALAAQDLRAQYPEWWVAETRIRTA
ncbi:4-(cytidine 5'-diphospho)-2-C-methyl-D-erythritol kinase [Sphingobium bisphenolivorans]|uniref:4-(cytidine 5'-diphospho)-2-C-methyl-D-erythritol kinase n=1 Tax=Sphingobium bisphenolivorans TaxID=1335760 RepID=UPI0003A848E7|nr:4-(cytidine 5'-diphospho)-2-C-methyl-D-erythritol kinase [Sphingobium bisphenolivorans]